MLLLKCSAMVIASYWITKKPGWHFHWQVHLSNIRREGPGCASRHRTDRCCLQFFKEDHHRAFWDHHCFRPCQRCHFQRYGCNIATTNFSKDEGLSCIFTRLLVLCVHYQAPQWLVLGLFSKLPLSFCAFGNRGNVPSVVVLWCLTHS